ncbi:redox-regulated ATPase YchF [Patescibacteria group bacterium]|nr:redox-regulated ATPase YchF [Patescibacteria group bacterium]MBU4056847.1 redox-regulated ATPase YchF [Patescibacteria group bacterium]
MSFSIGIVGLPNVGKSTLFKALTKKQVNIANYPFCTIDPNVGVVKVPDERLEKLAKMSQSEKIVPTAIEFVDIAGLVRGANKGEGLGNQFLANIREVDAIAHIVRIFEDKEIIHVDKNIDPKRDIETISTELIMKDMETLEKRIIKVSGEAKAGKKEKVQELENLNAIKTILEKGGLLYGREFDEPSQKLIKELQLLTAKPMLFVFNKKIEAKSDEKQLEKTLAEVGIKMPFVLVDIKMEADLGELTDEEKVNYKKDLGISEDGIDRLIKSSYQLLDLVTYLTTGKDETRAWTIKRGAKAPQAAGIIHTDFEKKFIRAEVINWQKLLEAGSWSKAAELGLLRTEGKEYVVQDGDVIEFKI